MSLFAPLLVVTHTAAAPMTSQVCVLCVGKKKKIKESSQRDGTPQEKRQVMRLKSVELGEKVTPEG